MKHIICKRIRNTSYTCQLKKNALPKRWELCFIWWAKIQAKTQHHSKILFQRGSRGNQAIWEFLQQRPVVRTPKDCYELKKTRYLKWRNLALFYVWEDARVWAHWNRSFDVHLIYAGPIPCVFSSWVSSGCTVGGWLKCLMIWWREALCFYPEFPLGSPSEQLSRDDLIAATSFVYWYGRQYFSFTYTKRKIIIIITGCIIYKSIREKSVYLANVSHFNPLSCLVQSLSCVWLFAT